MIGKSNRVYEVYNYKCSFTLRMIRRLHEGLGIPAEALIMRWRALVESVSHSESELFIV